MNRFRRTFILATLIGVAIGFLLQRAQSPRLGEVGTGFDAERRLAPLERAPGDAPLEGRVVDPSGAAVADVAVVAVDARGVHSVWPDAEGRFAFAGLAPGDVELHLAGIARPGSSHAASVPSEGPLELVAEAPWPELETLPSLERAPLVGRVEPPPAGGAGGYEVLLTPDGEPRVEGLAGRTPRRARVRPDGGFDVEGLAHGRYRASLLPPWASGGSWPELVVVGFEHGDPPTELRLPGSSGALVGRLVDLEGEPVVGALVTLRSASDPARRWPSVESGTDGHFRIGDLPGGSYDVRVTAGRAEFERSLRVPSLRSVTLDVPPLDVRSRP